MYHSALVALKPHGGNGALTEMAIQLAKRHTLQLTALAVIDPAIVRPTEAVPLGAAAYKEHKDDLVKQQTLEAAQEEIDAFAQACEAGGVPCTSMIREGSIHDEVPLAVQSCDLFLVGHGGEAEAGTEPREDITRLDSMLKYSARPCILVPTHREGVARITVAYDGSIQAARTLHDFANSGLWAGSAVDVVSIAEDTAAAGILAERGAAYLASHGFATTAQPMIGRHDVGARIVEFVESSGADALVMGAYGKNRWREFVFGTVTRDVLRAIMVPVFMSH